MAVGCEIFCPRINTLKMLESTTDLFSIYDGGFSLDSSRTDALNTAIVRSGNCSGPVTEIRTIHTGIIHRSTVQEEVLVCGLDQRHLPKTATTIQS